MKYVLFFILGHPEPSDIQELPELGFNFFFFFCSSSVGLIGNLWPGRLSRAGSSPSSSFFYFFSFFFWFRNVFFFLSLSFFLGGSRSPSIFFRTGVTSGSAFPTSVTLRFIGAVLPSDGLGCSHCSDVAVITLPNNSLLFIALR